MPSPICDISEPRLKSTRYKTVCESQGLPQRFSGNTVVGNCQVKGSNPAVTAPTALYHWYIGTVSSPTD